MSTNVYSALNSNLLTAGRVCSVSLGHKPVSFSRKHLCLHLRHKHRCSRRRRTEGWAPVRRRRGGSGGKGGRGSRRRLGDSLQRWGDGGPQELDASPCWNQKTLWAACQRGDAGVELRASASEVPDAWTDLLPRTGWGRGGRERKGEAGKRAQVSIASHLVGSLMHFVTTEKVS